MYEEQNVTRFPMDVTPLQRGDVINTQQLERITGEQPGTEKYKLCVMGVRAWIKRELFRMGRQWEVVHVGDTLRVLTNLEQSEYEHVRTERGATMIREGHAMAAAVDVTEFSEAEKQKHERRLEVQGRKVLGLEMAKDKRLTVAPQSKQMK